MRRLALMILICAADVPLSAAPCEPCPSDAAGCLQGVLVDTTGGALPGASVRLLEATPSSGSGLPEGGELHTTSNGEGRFFLADVPVGSQRIELALSGFATGETASFRVVAGQTLDLGELTMSIATDQRKRSTIAHGVSPSCHAEACTTGGPVGPAELLAWVDWIGTDYGEAELVEGSDEPPFIRARPAAITSWSGSEHADGVDPTEVDVSDWRCVFDPDRFNVVRMRIRHTSAFTHFGGFWLHRHGAVDESIDPRVDLPCLQAQPLPSDGEWHDVVFHLDDSPNWNGDDDVVYVHLGFTGAGGTCGYDTRLGGNKWAPAHPADEAYQDFAEAMTRTKPDAYVDVALLEFAKR